jgi:hypothetical protein
MRPKGIHGQVTPVSPVRQPHSPNRMIERDTTARATDDLRADSATMVGGQVALPGPGMPGAQGPPPGWRRRGRRRPPCTSRTARSRRPATRRPHPADPARSPWTLAAASTAYWSFAFCRRRRPHSGRTAHTVPPGTTGRSGWPAPLQRISGDVEEYVAGKVSFRGYSGASSLSNANVPASQASPPSRTRRAVTVSSGGTRFLPGISRR